MSLKSVLLTGVAALSLSLLSPAFATPALADDQSDETRELNLRQLDNPGYTDQDDDDDDGVGADEDDDEDDGVGPNPLGGDDADDDDGADDEGDD